MMKINELSIVIPVYNERENLESLLEEINVALKSVFKFEVVIVDDGSQDGSQEQLQKLTHTLDYLHPIYHRRNFGQSASIATGINAAQYEWIVTLDGDRQNDPNDIPKLIQTLEHTLNQEINRKVVLVGNRQKRIDTWIRRISTRIANGIRRRLLKDNCPDTGCSLKIFPKEAFLQLPHFNHMHRFLPALFKRAGFEVINSPVNHRPRVKGESKYGIRNRLWVGIIDLLGVMWLIRRPTKVEIRHDAP